MKQERTSILHPSFPISTIALESGASAVKVLEQNWKKKVNERALRFFLMKTTHYRELLNKIGLVSLNNLRLAEIVCMVFRAVSYDHTPKSTKNLLDFRNTKYDLREPTFEKLPKVNTTTYGMKSWRYRAP